MVIDNLDVVAAARKSVESLKAFFWTVLGINVLYNHCRIIIGAILSFINVIPARSNYL